ncbi:MAG: hypothetical protein ACFFBD_20145, partial [Candidatus Hodarchaeota archaeon]
EQCYFFRVWIRTDDQVDEGEVFILIAYYDAWDRYTLDSFVCRPSPNWQATNFVMETIPSSTVKFNVYLCLLHSPGTVWLDYLFLGQLTEAEYINATLLGKFRPPNITQGLPQGSTASVTHLEKINGAWWLVDPDGSPFWSTSVLRTHNVATYNPYLWASLSPSERDNFWKTSKVRAKNEFFFNTEVRNTVNGPTENYIAWLNMGTQASETEASKWIMRDADGNGWGGWMGMHQFPDPFDPDWEAYVDAVANSIPEWFLQDSNNIGYWTDNEMMYGATWNYYWNEACSTALIEWLQGTGNYTNSSLYSQPNTYYTSIAELNAAWSSGYHTYSYSSFADIAGTDKPQIRGWNDTQVMADLQAFERVVYQKYVKTIISAIRAREDSLGYPRRLIMANRWGYGGPSYAADAIERVIDIFSAFDILGVNAYPAMNRARDHYPYEHIKFIEEIIYGKTGRPIIISEFGVSAVDSGIEIGRWRPHTVDTQEQRGISYRNIISMLVNMPWCVGAHLYAYTNYYYEEDGVTPNPCNCGLVNDSNEPYPNYSDYIISTNQKVNQCSRTMSSIDDLAWDSLIITVIDNITLENGQKALKPNKVSEKSSRGKFFDENDKNSSFLQAMIADQKIKMEYKRLELNQFLLPARGSGKPTYIS